MSNFEQRVAVTLQQLRQWCADQGIQPAGDGAVSEQVACRLLGYSDGALAKQHELGRLIIPYRRLGPSRRLYRLHDIALHIEHSFVENPA